jgi:hypothetical protein
MTTRRLAGLTGIHRRRAAIAAAAAALLAFTSLAAASSATSAASASTTTAPAPPPAFSPLPSGGLLTLTTAPGAVSTGAVIYSVNGVDTVQTLTGGANCLLQTDSSLMSLTGSPPPPFTMATTNSASFKTGSIGVADKSTGVSCFRVSTTGAESLKLDVTIGRPSGPKQPVATSAFLDVELKGSGARVQAITSLNGVPNGVFEVQTGAVTAPASVVGLPATVVARCSSSADSGSDDHETDNCHWPISAPSWLAAVDDGIAFDSITLKPLTGSFSLEGGSDGLVQPLPPVNFPQRGSIFELADGILSCGNATISLPLDATKPAVAITRLDNANPASPCAPIPYTLTHDNSSTTFTKPLNQQTSAQFIVNTTWASPISATTSATILPPPATQPVTTVTFPGLGPIPLGWCPNPIYSGTTLMGITNPQTAVPDLDNNPANGVQFACLGSSSASINPINTAQLLTVEQIYLEGDVAFNRGA